LIISNSLSVFVNKYVISILWFHRPGFTMSNLLVISIVE
jgi:hypothetical protein